MINQPIPAPGTRTLFRGNVVIICPQCESKSIARGLLSDTECEQMRKYFCSDCGKHWTEYTPACYECESRVECLAF